MIPEDLQVPGYDIEQRIGRGGMASVYRARQHTFDRDVALKVLKPDLSEDELFCQRFVQESLIVAKLHHSNIVQVYDVGEFKHNFYIAMEYLNGGDLNTRLKEGLSVKDTIKIVSQAASALDFAHQKGIIHRDIKPDNIMFREDGAAVITDFGIAKEIDSDMNLTQTGLIVGTPKYMAPEQIRGSAPTPQADIYALGILMFQCLTNHVPFLGKDMIATAYKHFNEPVPKLPPLVAAFQPMLDIMLAKKPEARYHRAMEVLDALEALSGNNRSQLTNLDITKAFVLPSSDFDPTIVHPHNQETHLQQQLDDTTAITEVDALQQATTNHTQNTVNASSINPKLILASAVAILAVVAGVFIALPTNNTLPPPEASRNTATDNTNTAQTMTVTRLLSEAQNDIQQRRLKKPDSNNAFNKLQRVLEMDANNPEALAAMQQIAEEYVKLADAALAKRDYANTDAYLEHARSAASDLNTISLVQNHLDAARATVKNKKASILSMEKSLMIDGLLKSAAIDEEEGRVRSPVSDNALEKYRRILTIDPNNNIALAKVTELSR